MKEKAAVLDSEDRVQNIILIETDNPISENLVVLAKGVSAGIGWLYDRVEDIFFEEEVTPEPDPVEEVQSQLDALLLETLMGGMVTQEQIDMLLITTLDQQMMQEQQQSQIDELILMSLS